MATDDANTGRVNSSTGGSLYFRCRDNGLAFPDTEMKNIKCYRANYRTHKTGPVYGMGNLPLTTSARLKYPEWLVCH